ncbi:MAG: hypothetical protein ACR2FP_05635 [Nocardioidaceae bacterium]
MARQLFLHVGTPKTGTSYLQSVIWANEQALKHAGLLLPLGSAREHFYLSNVARDAVRAKAAMPRAGQTAWARLLEQLEGWDSDALISHELFTAVPPERITWVRQEFAKVSDSLHIIVTARDFARQVPAEWQQSIKHGRTHSLREYCERLRATDPDKPADQRAKSSPFFWRVQHLPRVLDKWGTDLPAAQVHLVTVPSSNAPRGLLWQRFASVLDIDSESVEQSNTLPNESLGIDEIEMLRRVNTLIPRSLPTPQVQLLVKQILSEGVLASRAGMRKIQTPADLHAWMVERGTAMTEQLRPRNWSLVGDLDELVPGPRPAGGALPDDVDDRTVAAVAVETVAGLLFDRDDLPTQRLVAQQRTLASELEKRSARVDELRDALRQERDVREWERHHPVRAQARRVTGRLRRQCKPAAAPD